MKIPVSPHSNQYLLFSVFFNPVDEISKNHYPYSSEAMAVLTKTAEEINPSNSILIKLKIVCTFMFSRDRTVKQGVYIYV